MRVVVTGGAGFIGSHQVVALAEAGHEPHIVDDLSNSDGEVLSRLEQIIGREVPFTSLDVRDKAAMTDLLAQVRPEAVIHFAARKHVPESMEKPIEYYDVNITGLLSLIHAMRATGVRRLVFSSSGSVYGAARTLPIPEDAPHQPTNPYSTTKSWGERICADLCRTEPDWVVTALRYFNPAGAHPSGLIGEDPSGLLTNLLPVLMHVAVGNLDELVVSGDDFDTPDGSGVRDYVHVMDVAVAHVRALEKMTAGAGFRALNIGRGEGVSVLQMIAAVERVTGKPVPYRIGERRPGDVPALYADTSQAKQELGLDRYADLDRICADAWNWQQANPHGYVG